MFEHALRKSSTLRQYFRSWGWVVAEVAICTPDAKPLAFMQALSEASLFSTFDLTLFAKLQLDQGSLIRQEDGLHSDEAFRGTPLPFSIVPDCTSLLQQLQILTNNTSDGINTGDYEASPESAEQGPLVGLPQNCATATLKEMPSTLEIDAELYCTFSRNTVCLCPLSAAGENFAVGVYFFSVATRKIHLKSVAVGIHGDIDDEPCCSFRKNAMLFRHIADARFRYID